MTKTTIQLTDVSKSFGETRALVGCTFQANAGEVHAIVGENGSGKSTLAKIMSGVLSPDTGTVEILGGPVASPLDAKARGLATIFQEVLVADDANVLDNLYVGREGLLFDRQDRKERVREAQEIMDRFTGAHVDLNARVGDLPLSSKQWIVIARAVLCRPRILILDESSAALDLDATQRLHTEIDRLRSAGVTILLVTHRIAELVRIADRATILRDGAAIGFLTRGEITEARLLELMTPQDRTLAAAPQLSVGTARQIAPIVSARNIRIPGGGGAFDFDLSPGQIVGLVGLDGQGQDEFAKSLAGIAPPEGGEITILGRDKTQRPVVDLSTATAEGVSWVSGDRKREGILPDQSIFENLAIGVYRRHLRPLGIVDKKIAARLFEQEVSRLSIKTGPPSNKIISLSGGNQQKILIGRSFANEPRVIVLNDPARGVDLGTKRDLYRELRAFAEKGGAVVYLSSEIEEFLGFADRVDVFFRGTLFRSLVGDQVNEDAMLAAMFGQPAGTHVEIDMGEAV